MKPDRQKSSLTYLLGEATIMASLAQEKYNQAMTEAYRTKGIREKRKVFRGFQAQVKGLLARLKELRK